MPVEPAKHVLVLVSFLLALTAFAVGIGRGASVPHAAFSALCLMLACALILLHTARAMGQSLARFMRTHGQTPSRHADS